MKHETTFQEPRFRLNVKRNYKKEIGYEYTVRADTIEDLAVLNAQIKRLVSVEIEQDGSKK